MTITYDAISNTIRTPGQFIEFNSTKASPALPGMPHRTLLIGQKLAGAGAAALAITTLNQASDAIAAFGAGSMLERMAAAHVPQIGSIPCDAIALADNGAGVAAIFTTTITGAPTAAGTLPFYINGVAAPIAVAVGETVASLAAALAAEINENNLLPVTATAAAGVVTHTCKWKGATGSDIDFRLAIYDGDVVPAGIGVNTVNATEGTGNPDITPLIAAIGDIWYDTIVMPYTDAANLTVLETELSSRFGPMRQIDGRAFASARGSQGTLAAFGESRNSPSVCTVEATGPSSTWERAACFAGVMAYNLAIDPARPEQTLVLPGIVAPAPDERFTRTQRDALLHDGISTTTVDGGGNVLIERAITMYQTNAEGAPDTAYLNVTTLATLSYLRWSERNRIATKFPRYKLADDGISVAPGQAIVTPSIVAAELVALSLDWQDAGLVENVADYKSSLIVQRDATNRDMLDVLSSPTIVGGLRVYADQIQFQL